MVHPSATAAPSAAQKSQTVTMSASGAPRASSTAFESSPQRLLDTAARLGQRPAYLVRGDDGWAATSWTEYAEQAQRAARALLELGVAHGQSVAILGFNRAEWSVMAFGALLIGAVPVGIYWTSSCDDIRYILGHSQAPVLLVENQAHLAKVQSCQADLSHLRHIILMRGTPPQGTDQLSWDAFLALGRDEHQATVLSRLKALKPQDTGSLIYTSGTTGPAKAVVLSHANLSWTAAAMVDAMSANEHDRLLSYLPFAHIAEQIGCLHAHACAGFAVYYARSIEELGDHLKEVHPTCFFGVPRVWEKIQAGVQGKLQQATGFKAAMAGWALDVGQRSNALLIEGRRGSWGLRLQKRLADRLVFRKVKAALGLDQARLLISAAAPISVEKLRFLSGLDLIVRESYGQSEACGPSTISAAGSTRVGSVGKPLRGTEVRIADDGEILLRGPNIFQGYAGRPEATAETLQDGWMHSGDLGHLDADGFLYITGRKKDLIITSGGKNISPGNLEADLSDVPLIEHAVVCGDGRHYLTALLTLDAAVLAAFGRTHGLPEAGLHQHSRVLQALQEAIDEVNTHHARVSHIRRFAVLPRSLSIDGGELTPTMKVKRKVVIDRQQAEIEALYREVPGGA